MRRAWASRPTPRAVYAGIEHADAGPRSPEPNPDYSKLLFSAAAGQRQYPPGQQRAGRWARPRGAGFPAPAASPRRQRALIARQPGPSAPQRSQPRLCWPALVPGESGEIDDGHPRVPLRKAKDSPGRVVRPAVRSRRSQQPAAQTFSAHGVPHRRGAVLRAFLLVTRWSAEIIMSFQKTHLGVTTWGRVDELQSGSSTIRSFGDGLGQTRWSSPGSPWSSGNAVPFFHRESLLNELRQRQGLSPGSWSTCR